MNDEQPEKLSLPSTVPDLALLSFKISLAEIEQVYGIAHQGLSDMWEVPGPTLYWGLEYICGLRVILEFHETKNYVNICADAPEISHILTHLSFPQQPMWQIAPDDEMLLKYYGANNDEWLLWRQDDNGHKEIIQKYQWEREAKCRLRQFEKLHHKQTYWLENARDR